VSGKTARQILEDDNLEELENCRTGNCKVVEFAVAMTGCSNRWRP
jgi:hypothetical protein